MLSTRVVALANPRLGERSVSGVRRSKHGRRLDDIEVGRIYPHPWELTLDSGLTELFAGAVLDATPTYSSRLRAQELGFRDRPISPWLLLNLTLGMSAHNLFEDAVGHIAYLDIRFPEAAFVGDTVRCATRVEKARASANQDHGSIVAQSILTSSTAEVLCTVRRKVLVRSGSVAGRSESPATVGPWPDAGPTLPEVLRRGVQPPSHPSGFGGYFEDYDVGDVVIHAGGRTVGDTEHMLLALASRNTHPLHTNETLCREKSTTGTRIVAGGLVLSWTLALASRDFGGNSIWELGLDQGAHPADVLAGDTLHATTKVLAKEDAGPHSGVVTLRTVGTKNQTGDDLFLSGLFTPEAAKADGKLPAKVVEITRQLLILKRPG